MPLEGFEKWDWNVPLKEYEFFKPEPGQYKVVVVEELGVKKDERGKRVFLQIEWESWSGNKGKSIWAVRVSDSVKSLYGQLQTIRQKKGTLTGIPLSVTVAGEGQNRRYSVKEVVTEEQVK